MLRAHQVSGASWLAPRDRAYLGDAPRVGKTRTILEALRLREGTNTLVVCPAIVRDHWAAEAKAMGMRMAAIKSFDEITRGGNALMKLLITGHDINSLVIDEAHACKNADALRTKQLLGKDGYARRMETVYCASGTPIPKHAGELWTIMSALFPGVAIAHGMFCYRDWIDRFCVEHVVTRGTWGRSILAPISGALKNPAELREIMDEIMLRRTLDDLGADVPPVDWQVTPLSATRGRRLDELDKAALMQLEQYNGKMEDMAREPHIMRMRQRLGVIKAPLVVDMLKTELTDSNEKIVVFAHHADVLSALFDGLAEFNPMLVTGATSNRTRTAVMNQFQNQPSARVFIGQNMVCKEGITLHAANRVVIVEPDWTAVVNEQLGNRVLDTARPGRHCVAEMIALAGTLDTAILGQRMRELKMLSSVGLGRELHND